MIDLIEQLKLATEELRSIQLKKDAIVEQIAHLLNAPENKTKSFQIEDYKVEVKRGRNYKIDIEKLKQLDIPEDINPVKQVTKFEINKAKLAIFESKHEALYAEFLTWTPSKVSVTIKGVK